MSRQEKKRHENKPHRNSKTQHVYLIKDSKQNSQHVNLLVLDAGRQRTSTKTEPEQVGSVMCIQSTCRQSDEQIQTREKKKAVIIRPDPAGT